MALSPSSVRWWKTSGGYPTSPVASNTLGNVSGNIRIGDATDYALLALVNESATDSLLSTAVYLAVDSGGIALAIGKSALGIVANTSTRLVTDASDPTTGVTYSTPTTSGSSISVGTLAAGQMVGFWLRRTATGSARSPETNTLIVTGSSTI